MNSEVIKIYSNCFIMSKFSEKFKNKMIIQKEKPFERKISHTNFGFKKILIVEQNIQNKKWGINMVQFQIILRQLS